MRVKLAQAGEGGGCTPTPLSLHLPSPVKLQCTLQLSGQTQLPCFISSKKYVVYFLKSWTETHTKRQAPQHGCLPSLLGNGDKGIEKVYSEEKNFVIKRLDQPRQNKNLLYRHDKPKNQPRKNPSHMYSLSPHQPQFQQSAGATLSVSLVMDHKILYIVTRFFFLNLEFLNLK